ncbi:MAG: radical SAM protein [Candidatus Riflebacteria bacterium]|nr:radical SAM protein [Candidatus Riflebacteria bacterium]
MNIRNILRRIQLSLKMVTHGIPFYHSMIDKGYDVYLNHHKIIHWRDGYPVFTMSSPALFSKPMANFIIRNMFGVIQNRALPNMMSFAITPDCTLKCPQCSFADIAKVTTQKPLTIEESKKAIKSAQQMGVSVITLTGGEPLTCPHLDELLRCIDKDVSTVAVFTSGLELEVRAANLRKAGLDGVYVSIDEPEADLHDLHRGQKGLFDTAMRGVKAAKKAGLTVGFSVCAFPDSIKTGRLERIIELGRKCGVHEIVIFSAAPSGNLKDRQDLCKTDWIEEIITFSEKYKEDHRYPGLLVYNHNASWRGLGCSGGTRWFFLDPYGNVNPCDFNHLKIGNIKEEPLHLIWDRLSSLPPFQQTTWTGCKLRDPQYRDGNLRQYINP